MLADTTPPHTRRTIIIILSHNVKVVGIHNVSSKDAWLCVASNISTDCVMLCTHIHVGMYFGGDAVTFAKFMLMFKDSPAKPLYERRTYFAFMSRSRWIFFAELQILSNIKVKLQPSTTPSPITSVSSDLMQKSLFGLLVYSVSTYKHDFERCFVVVAGSWRWENFTNLMLLRLFGHNSHHPITIDRFTLW